MDVDIPGYLASKGIEYKTRGYELYTHCWWHGEDTDNPRGRLYINVDPNQSPPGLFECKVCGERGAFNKIRKWFGDPALRDDGTPYGANEQEPELPPSPIIDVAAAYYHECLIENEELLMYLIKDRGLSADTIIEFRLGYADGKLLSYLREQGFSDQQIIESKLVWENTTTDFFQDKLIIPYMVHGTAVTLRGRALPGSADESGKKYQTLPGDKARLFNVDAIANDTVILTEGEFDAMVLSELGYHAVGVPGANTWQQEWTAMFKDTRRVFVCFDNDQAGQKGAERVQKELGSKVRIVAMPENLPGEPKNDPSYWLTHGGGSQEEFELLLMKAKGSILVSVSEAYEEWCQVEGAGLVGMPTGYDLIDEAIRPGILPSQVMVVLAKTGAGKTQLLLNMFHRIFDQRPESKILFVSLEQTRNEWFERARRIHNFYNLDANNQDTINFFKDRFMLVDKNRVTEDEMVGALDDFFFEFGQYPDLVAVDYLGYWARAYKGEAYERTSAAIMAMKAMAKEFRVPFITPHQVGRGAGAGEEPDLSAARDSGVVEETADFLLSMWRTDQRRGRNQNEMTGEVHLKILKSRHGGVATHLTMVSTPATLALVPQQDPLYDKALKERQWIHRRDTYEDVLLRLKTGITDITPGWQEEARRILGL